MTQDERQHALECLVNDWGYQDVIEALATVCMVWSDQGIDAPVQGAPRGLWALRARALWQLLEDDQSTVEAMP